MRKPLTKEQKLSIKKYKKTYYEANKKILAKKRKKKRKNNVILFKKRDKVYYEKNKNKIIERSKKYYKSYKLRPVSEKRKENSRSRKLKYYHTNKGNAVFDLRISISNLIRHGFNSKNIKKSMSSEKILGCSFIDFKQHLESQFKSWMNWQNRGLYNGEPNYGWDIDHIIPISSAKTCDDIIILNHYTNLQPLCSKINRDVKKANY